MSDVNLSKEKWRDYARKVFDQMRIIDDRLLQYRQQSLENIFSIFGEPFYIQNQEKIKAISSTLYQYQIHIEGMIYQVLSYDPTFHEKESEETIVHAQRIKNKINSFFSLKESELNQHSLEQLISTSSLIQLIFYKEKLKNDERLIQTRDFALWNIDESLIHRYGHENRMKAIEIKNELFGSYESLPVAKLYTYIEKLKKIFPQDPFFEKDKMFFTEKNFFTKKKLEKKQHGVISTAA